MTLLRCITGSETFDNGSASLLLSMVESQQFPMASKKGYVPGRGLFASEAAKMGFHARQTQRPVYLPAAANGVRELGCYWDSTIDIDPGVILKLYARRSLRIGSRPSVDQGTVFIQIRDAAPLNRLTLHRISNDMSTNAPVLIEGRFDILSLRDAGAAKVAISAEDLSLSRAERVRSVLEHTEVAPALQPRGKVKIERVTDHTGQQRIVTTTRSRRPIDLG